MTSSVNYLTCCGFLQILYRDEKEAWVGKWGLQDNWTIPQMTLCAENFVKWRQQFPPIVADRSQTIQRMAQSLKGQKTSETSKAWSTGGQRSALPKPRSQTGNYTNSCPHLPRPATRWTRVINPGVRENRSFRTQEPQLFTHKTMQVIYSSTPYTQTNLGKKPKMGQRPESKIECFLLEMPSTT